MSDQETRERYERDREAAEAARERLALKMARSIESLWRRLRLTPMQREQRLRKFEEAVKRIEERRHGH
jgi:hypothetical protein